NVRRWISLQSSLARVPAVTRFARPSGQPSAVQFCSNKIVHAPARSFGVIQTMLLALVTIGLERMGREKQQQIERVLAACGRIFRFVFCFARAARSKKHAGVAAAVLSAPIARRNEPSLTGPPGWTGRGSWRTTRLTIRGCRQ